MCVLCASACRPEALFLLRLLGKMFGANQWRTTGTPTKRPHHQRAPVVINLAPSTQRACRYQACICLCCYKLGACKSMHGVKFGTFSTCDGFISH